MDANEFTVYFLNSLNGKLLDKKRNYLMGDFNNNLLRYSEDHKSTNFLYQIYFCSLIPRIPSPTSLSPPSKEALTDNIFSTDTANKAIAENISTSISDHPAQFYLFPIKRTKPEPNKNADATLNDLILKYFYRSPNSTRSTQTHNTQTYRSGTQHSNSTKKILITCLINFSKSLKTF